MVQTACFAALALLLSFVHAVAAERGNWRIGVGHPYDMEEFVEMARGAPPENHFTLKLSVTRDSKWDTEISSSEYQQSHHVKMRGEPMDVAVKLVPRRHFISWGRHPHLYPFGGIRGYLSRYILGRAHEWLVLDSEKKVIEKLDDLEEDARVYEHYKALKGAMPDLERRLKAIDAYAEDARRILRLLQGIVFYEYGTKQKGDHVQPNAPLSGPVQARSSGWKWQERRRDTSGTTNVTWWSVEATAEPWSADDVERERDWRPFMGDSGGVRAIVWRFRPEDMERIRALIADFDAVEKALFEDGYSGKQTMADAQRHAHFNTTFWEPLRGGLQQVVTFAWALSPHRPPDGMFIGDQDYSAPSRILNVENWTLRPDAPLVLPPISGDTLMRLRLPLKTFGKLPPAEKVSFPIVRHHINVDGRYDSENQSSVKFSMICLACTPKPSIEALGDSDTQWTRQRQREDDDTPLFNYEPILVSANTSGAVFRGDYSIIWKIDRKLYDDEVGYRLEGHRYSVGWELVEMGPGIFIAQGAGEGVQP